MATCVGTMHRSPGNRRVVLESSKTALDLAGEMPSDLILLDVLMPDMDGFETCAKIHLTEVSRGLKHDQADVQYHAAIFSCICS